jgi:hypothetical protein
MLRKFAFSLIGICVVCGSVAAQEWATKMFAVQAHDFGTVARGAKAEFDFVVTNVYGEDIHLAGVRSSCGCTTPQITQPLLKPDEKGSVRATFNTDRFTGKRGATLTVSIDRPYPAEVQLRIDGYIRTDVMFTPGSVQLGSVEQGIAATQKVSLNFSGRTDWQAVEVRSVNPHLKGTLTEAGRTYGQVNYELEVALDKDAPAGYLKDQLIVVTNDPQGPQIPLAVEGRVLSNLTVNPAALFLGVVQPGQKVTKQLVVQGKQPFRIAAITCDDPGFSFTTDNAEKPLHLIPVTFVAGNESGNVMRSIRIVTNLGDTSLEVPATAVVTRSVAAQ